MYQHLLAEPEPAEKPEEQTEEEPLKIDETNVHFKKEEPEYEEEVEEEEEEEEDYEEEPEKIDIDNYFLKDEQDELVPEDDIVQVDDDREYEQEEEDEEEISDVDDEELLKKLERKYGKLPSQHSEDSDKNEAEGGTEEGKTHGKFVSDNVGHVQEC